MGDFSAALSTDPTKKLVANQFGTMDGLPYRIAFVGDAPGFDETTCGLPFMGQAGRLLEGCMNTAQIARRASFMGYVSQERPPNNTIARMRWDGTEIQSGMRQLAQDLRTYKPHLVVLLGAVALKAARDPSGVHPLVTAKFRHKIDAERGSVFRCTDPASPMFNFKCMGTYAPMTVLQQYKNLVLFQFDLTRARREGQDGDLHYPNRTYHIDLGAHAMIERMRAIKPGTITSIDIEGGLVLQKKSKFKDPDTGESIMGYKPSCVPELSISTDPSEAFVIHFGSHSEYEEGELLKALSILCFDEKIPKLFQNGVYDTFVMWWMFKILVRNHCYDTMLSGWEIYPELPKALGVQASLYTNEPYWKSERTSDDLATRLRYNCTDAAVTLEIHQRQMEVMSPAQKEHYAFNASLLPVFTYMELRGIHWDGAAAKQKATDLGAMMAEPWARMQVRAKQFNIPEHKTQKGVHFNPNISAGNHAVPKLLYDVMGYAPQYKREGGRKTTSKTADKLALLTLLRKHPQDTFLGDILLWRKLKKLQEQASTKIDTDGRIRCSYNQVGTETGRVSSQAAPTGCGMNLQTLTKPLRHLARADEGYFFFQIDLEGADGWTVACRCKQLAHDPTMLEDYRFGIKPAWVIALMYMMNSPKDRPMLLSEISMFGDNMAKWPREGIRDCAKRFFAKTSDPDLYARYDWLYFASKRVQHGSNYGLGKIQMSNQILQDSYKMAPAPILLPAKECDHLKQLYLGGRYMAVQRWQQWIKATLLKTGSLNCASGHIRRFFGRKNDPATINAALSHEPQANTTYVTNLGLRRLWLDPANRNDDQSLIIEPLHQVHDAMCGQFPIAKVDWAKEKLKNYMYNPVTIADETLVIPYEGEYGPNWKDMNSGTIYMDK
tara:strand:- start:27683 stop:30352 length:2670 start_codon:yes stop_codon:yes gene_type:complete